MHICIPWFQRIQSQPAVSEALFIVCLSRWHCQGFPANIPYITPVLLPALNQPRQEKMLLEMLCFTRALTLSITLPSHPLTDCEAQSGELGLSRTLIALLICLCPCFSWVCSYLMFYWRGGSCCTQRHTSYLALAAGKAQEESRKKLPVNIQQKSWVFILDFTLINSVLQDWTN